MLKGTYYAKLTFSLLLYVYLRIRSASPPFKRKFRQLSQCFVICRVKNWVCKQDVWISPGLWRHNPGDLNILALAPGISAHTSSATWTRIRHCVDSRFTCTRQPDLYDVQPESQARVAIVTRQPDRYDVQPESQALLLCRRMHGSSCFATSPPYQRAPPIGQHPPPPPPRQS